LTEASNSKIASTGECTVRGHVSYTVCRTKTGKSYLFCSLHAVRLKKDQSTSSIKLIKHKILYTTQ